LQSIAVGIQHGKKLVEWRAVELYQSTLTETHLWVPLLSNS